MGIARSIAICRSSAEPNRKRLPRDHATWKVPLSQAILVQGMTTPSHIDEVRGIELDYQTRCIHYNSPLDIIAIKMKCCGVYYACKECHDALAGHPIEIWPQTEWNQPAVLCGACGNELTIANYMASGYKCPACDAAFNPGCRSHYHFYFGEKT